jgi:hypothetical protein
MDLFEFQQPYNVLICRKCKYCVRPTASALTTHLCSKHKSHPDVRLRDRVGGAACIARLISKSFPGAVDPKQTPIPYPASTSPPIPGLSLHSGLKCSKCPKIMTTSLHAENTMSRHFQIHRTVRNTRGGRHIPLQHLYENGNPIFTHVHCQRFFATGPQSSYFEVTPEPNEHAAVDHPVVQENRRRAALPREVLLRELINTELDSSQRALEADLGDCQGTTIATEVDPWLDATRWQQLFANVPLLKAAPLGHMPAPNLEPDLCVLAESVDRLVDQAHAAVCEDKVGFFDQFRINSFINGSTSRASEKALMVNLRKESYRAYKYTWKRLLCFVCRTSYAGDHGQTFFLPHQYTAVQLTCIREATKQAMELCEGQNKDLRALDRATLLLCIALLDHPLRGSVFESPIVVFLAVLGIDEKNAGAFHSAATYSPVLSKFIKISQMLVIQRAVMAAEDGDVEYPADMLDDLRGRFLVQGSRSPFNWAYKQRQVARKIASNTTGTGFIIWTEDCQRVAYHDISLTMGDLRAFVATQVNLAQRDLEGLLTLHEEESRREVVPLLQLYKLEDNHANNQGGWSFLNDTRNAGALRCGKSGAGQWLMDRVIENEWLSDEFLYLGKNSQIQWQKKRVEEYFQEVELFLERLLLLVHITSGQPARGTEMLTLRHTNTSHGHHRSIFIENGLVGTVTSYHKGYNVTGTLKIIHRYLPKEVSELLVYYLWLVLPFWQKLEVLVYKRKEPPSPYLWPKKVGSWDSSRLSKVLSREATLHLKIPNLNIRMYRHIAIAISRQHLKCGGFKRDYGPPEGGIYDQQAAHESLFAGAVYARGAEEAPGHVKAKRLQYRLVSREWHTFLGFQVGLGARKRTFADVAV